MSLGVSRYLREREVHKQGGGEDMRVTIHLATNQVGETTITALRVFGAADNVLGREHRLQRRMTQYREETTCEEQEGLQRRLQIRMILPLVGDEYISLLSFLSSTIFTSPLKSRQQKHTVSLFLDRMRTRLSSIPMEAKE